MTKWIKIKEEEMIYKFINQNADAFGSMFAEALRDVLKLYTIKDLKQIEKMLGIAEKSTTERKKRS